MTGGMPFFVILWQLKRKNETTTDIGLSICIVTGVCSQPFTLLVVYISTFGIAAI